MRHALTLGAATALLVLLFFLGVIVELIAFKGGYGIGGAVGSLLFIFIWYRLIRNNKPVWQPGRRYWMRWVWINIIVLMVDALDITSTFVLAYALAIMSLLWLIADGVKNFRDISITRKAVETTASQP